MRVLLQRVNYASVVVENEVIANIKHGLLLFVGFSKVDNNSGLNLKKIVEKIINLRIFPDESGRFNLSVSDIKAGILAVPQFTLFADTSKGRRPEFFNALEPNLAEKLFEDFIQLIKNAGVASVSKGKFGAHMKVLLENDGPVTIMLEM